MKTAADLSPAELIHIVDQIQAILYLNENGWTDPDKEVDGADFIAEVGTLMAEAGLIPAVQKSDSLEKISNAN